MARMRPDADKKIMNGLLSKSKNLPYPRNMRLCPVWV